MSFQKKLWIKQFLGRTNNSDVYWKNKAFELIYNAGPTFGSQASKHKTKSGRKKRVQLKKKKNRGGLKWRNSEKMIHYSGDKRHTSLTRKRQHLRSCAGRLTGFLKTVWEEPPSALGGIDQQAGDTKPAVSQPAFQTSGTISSSRTDDQAEIAFSHFYFLKKEAGCFQRTPSCPKGWKLGGNSLLGGWNVETRPGSQQLK